MSPPAPSARRVLFASLVGTTIEFYDFYIFATAAVLCLIAVVLIGLLASLAIAVVSLGLFDVADETNRGLFMRALAVANFGTIGFLCWTVLGKQT